MAKASQLYSSWLYDMSEHGKELFEQLYNKIIELEGTYPEPQEKSGHITFKLARKNRNKGSRFCCIHPASVPHVLRQYKAKETSMTMHVNNRAQKLDDPENFILKYTKLDNKNSGYVLINITNEKEIDIAMELVKQCYELLKRNLK